MTNYLSDDKLIIKTKLYKHRHPGKTIKIGYTQLDRHVSIYAKL